MQVDGGFGGGGGRTSDECWMLVVCWSVKQHADYCVGVSWMGWRGAVNFSSCIRHTRIMQIVCMRMCVVCLWTWTRKFDPKNLGILLWIINDGSSVGESPTQPYGQTIHTQTSPHKHTRNAITHVYTYMYLYMYIFINVLLRSTKEKCVHFKYVFVYSPVM